ncbi:hypothetical protein C5167_026455 [Papaver somniferum]|uniref:endochitinase EP3-like n=1 Tax=Papaver somniferum TaxID=3469 RepID=UPI000E6FADD4|nr:endochitinase EP3-like [Papaver somniferum]RZC85783.1 hypothetical protein C5167_026455 [Papaver somniferum]
MKTSSVLNLVSVVGILLGVLSQTIKCQNCGCGPNVCCSRFGICETTNQSCAVGCQQGPCTATPPATNVSISDIVTPVFFNGILSKASSSCSGKDFYSRGGFLDAVKSYSQFGKGGIYQKQEIAAFFAHETGHFCYIQEINGATRNYCYDSSVEYPCASGKGYYGRGPFMLSWNYNYGAAGKSIGFDGLNKPETVANDPVISFKTALWFWMNNVHSIITSGKGFGETIRAINGAIECNGANSTTVEARVGYYMGYCNQLGVPPGSNLRC